MADTPNFDAIENEEVRDYMKKRWEAQQGISNARDRQATIGTGASIVGNALTDFSNAQNKPVILANRMQDLGKAPSISEGEKRKYDQSGLDKLLANDVGAAQQNAQSVDKDYSVGRQVKQDMRQDKEWAGMDAVAARESDPNSQESKMAREYLKQVAPGAANVPNFQNLSASQVSKIAPGLFDKYKIDSQTQAHHEEMIQKSLDRKESRDARQAERSVGKPLASEVAQQIGQFDSAGKLLDSLAADRKAKTGTFSGITQYLPNTDAGQYKDAMRTAAQTIGGILEGGKLTDNDYSKYLDMLPTPGDSDERAANKVRILKEQIQRKKEGAISGAGAAGYNVRGFNQSSSEAPAEAPASKPGWAK